MPGSQDGNRFLPSQETLFRHPCGEAMPLSASTLDPYQGSQDGRGDSCIFRKHLLHPCGESLPLSASASASTLSGLFWFRPPLLGGHRMPHSSLLFLTILSELSQLIVPSIPSLVCRLSPVRGQTESTTASKVPESHRTTKTGRRTRFP